MKNVLYTIVTIISISLFSGCGDSSSTPSSQNAVAFAPQLNASPASNEIQVSWDTYDNATGYVLSWGISSSTLDNTEELTAAQTQYINTGLDESTIYYYRLTVLLESQEDVVSEVLAVKTGESVQLMQSDVGI